MVGTNMNPKTGAPRSAQRGKARRSVKTGCPSHVARGPDQLLIEGSALSLEGRPVDDNAMHDAFARIVVVDRVMPGLVVVPERH